MVWFYEFLLAGWYLRVTNKGRHIVLVKKTIVVKTAMVFEYMKKESIINKAIDLAYIN